MTKAKKKTASDPFSSLLGASEPAKAKSKYVSKRSVLASRVAEIVGDLESLVDLVQDGEVTMNDVTQRLEDVVQELVDLDDDLTATV